jgi:hypothetical protein
MKRFAFVLVLFIALSESSPFAQGIGPTGPFEAETPFFSFISIGVGLPAVSINLEDGAIGFFDSISPLTLTISPERFQGALLASRVTIDGKPVETWIRLSYWSVAFGLQVSKPQDSSEVRFGATLIPYLFRIGPLSMGIGVLWSATSHFSMELKTWNIILPLTYTVG